MRPKKNSPRGLVATTSAAASVTPATPATDRGALVRPFLPMPDPELRAILTRAMPYLADMVRPCCPDCERVRATTFSCQVCGYEGRPFVWPCECRTSRARTVAMMEAAIADAEPGATLVRWADTQTEADTLRAMIVEDRALGDRLCPSGEGAHCAHGAVSCPVCDGGPESGTLSSREDQAHPWRIIADLRAALEARGLL